MSRALILGGGGPVGLAWEAGQPGGCRPGFACTAVDTADGAFQVWERSCGIGLDRALASSCAVPNVYPPVTIKGRRWMDGGVRDFLNADSATGHDVVLAVSTGLLEPSEVGRPGMNTVMRATRARFDALRAGGARVKAVVPNEEMLELSGWGAHLMDYSRAATAYRVGERQGEARPPSSEPTGIPANRNRDWDSCSWKSSAAGKT